MRVKLIRLRNILGVSELEFSPGSFTEILGGNEAGKTSALEAIKSAFASGEDGTLLRKGATSGEAVLILEDGTEIERKLTNKTDTRAVRQNGGKVARPMEMIRNWADALSVNPIDFIRAPKRKRVDVMLESLPVQLDMGRVEAIVGSAVKAGTGSAFEQIEAIRQSVYDERTGTNRALKEKDATVSQLQATLPAHDPDAPADDDADSLVAELAEIDAEKDKMMDAIEKLLGDYRAKHDGALAIIRGGHQKVITDLRAQIAAIERQIAAEQKAESEAVAAENAEFAAIEVRAANKRTTETQNFATRRQATNAKLAVITANREAAGRNKQTRATIDKLKGEADALRADSERQTAALDALDAYKSEILASLPIEGLEVRDGEIFRHGIVFDRLNTAQQVDIAFEIARLRAGELPVICIDGIESLDQEHYEAFQQKVCQTPGLQVIATRVTAGELHVNTRD